MCKSDSIFPYLQRGTLLKWLLRSISWWDLSKTMNDDSFEGKISFD